MNLTHFKHLNRVIQTLIILTLIVSLVSFFTGLNTSRTPHSLWYSYFTWHYSHLSIVSPLFHILILWSIGEELVARWGQKIFLLAYVSYVPIIASMMLFVEILGGRTGVLSSTIYLDLSMVLSLTIIYPNRKISIFFLFEAPLKYASLFFVGLILLTSHQLSLYSQLFCLLPCLVFFMNQYLSKQSNMTEPERGLIYDFPLNDWGEKVVQKANIVQETFFEENKELDTLLKKISTHGRESLTEIEQSRLIEISQKMKERKEK